MPAPKPPSAAKAILDAPPPEIVEGEHDDIPERAFYMQGSIEQVLEEAKSMKGEEPSESAQAEAVNAIN